MKFAIVPISLFVMACGGSHPAPESAVEESSVEPPSSESTAATDSPTTFADQVTLGQQLYGEHCAKCHGASGEGGKAPAVVGLDKGALPLDPPTGAKYRTTQFKTVLDIAQFVTANMPPKKGGSLSDEQYWSILAFDLKANGIDLGDKRLDAALAATLDVPRK